MRWIKTILFLTFLILISCLKQPGNHLPVIESIILDPNENYTPGSDINISAIVTDEDGDPVDFYWDSQGGLISQPGHAATTWRLSARAEPLSYETITLTVSDRKQSVSKTETIQVSEGLMVWGFTYFPGTFIPIPGVEVFIGNFSAVSDEQGYYFIQNLKEGNTLVRAEKPGFKTFESMVYVDHPKSSYHIHLTSPTETMQVSGFVRTVDNLTYEGLRVVLLNPDGSESELQCITDKAGAFKIDSVPVGTRNFLIQSESPEAHFLNDSIIYFIKLDESLKSFEARIKIKRTLLLDTYLSQKEKWNFMGSVTDGFYLIDKGHSLKLKDFISIPLDAEDVMFYMNSYVVGGCDMVGELPSHRVWVSNDDNEYMGGISWGGEGSNFPAEISWYLSNYPTFLKIHGKQIKLHLEVFDENTCLSNPLWRVYQIEFSYYY